MRTITVFQKKAEKRMSEVTAKATLIVLEEYKKEIEKGTEQHFAINRALSKGFESMFTVFNVQWRFSRTLLRELKARGDLKAFLDHEKSLMFRYLADEIYKKDKFNVEQYSTYDDEVIDLSVGVLKI